ncbi:MAG: hypothetical protein WCC86_09040 [Methanoregula sp.]|uniref:hypothetical protein n=1 Tax=Methanoregula sp. TaxID=2052170 RepID=UPI003BAE78B9
MNTIKSTGNRIKSKTPVPENLIKIPVKSLDHSFPEFIDQESLDTLSRFGEKFRLAGIDGNPLEIQELTVFNAFLADHVQTNKISSVQCMLLWSEWVRTFQRQTAGFPNLIQEKEFRTIITDKFGVAIANNEIRGEIYNGIKFVP